MTTITVAAWKCSTILTLRRNERFLGQPVCTTNNNDITMLSLREVQRIQMYVCVCSTNKRDDTRRTMIPSGDVATTVVQYAVLQYLLAGTKAHERMIPTTTYVLARVTRTTTTTRSREIQKTCFYVYIGRKKERIIVLEFE
jgi:hypothetical protein